MNIARIVFVLMFLSQAVTAQFTEVINSTRPGYSYSPYSIGKDVFQLEMGYFHKEYSKLNVNDFTQLDGGVLLFRYGQFSEKLEFNLESSYQKGFIYMLNPQEIGGYLDVENEFGNKPNEFSLNPVSGINKLTVGVKYLFFEKKFEDKSREIRSWKKRMAFDRKRYIPSIGLYLGANTNIIEGDFSDKSVSIKAALLLQHNFTESTALLTNVIVDNILFEQIKYGLVLSFTQAITNRFSFFIEGLGERESQKNAFQLGGGIAFLFSPNLQMDTSVRTNISSYQPYKQYGVGFSWRLVKRKDKLAEANKKSGIKRKKQSNKGKGKRSKLKEKIKKLNPFKRKG